MSLTVTKNRINKLSVRTLAALSLLILPLVGWGQTTLVNWNFSDSNQIVDIATTPNANKSIGAVVGASNTFSYPGGTNPAISAIAWDGGSGSKYWQIEFETIGYNNVLLSSKQQSSNTGPKDFKVQYSIGTTGTWTDVASASVTVANNLTTGVLSNIALPNAAWNQPSVSLRWIMTSNLAVNGTTVASSGTSRIDDILVTGVAPVITVGTSGSLSFSTTTGTSSVAQSYSLNGSTLAADIEVVAPAGYEVSQTNPNSGYGASQTVMQVNGTVSTTIYVRLTGATAGTYGTAASPVNVANTSTGNTQNVAVYGTVNAPMPVTLTSFTATRQPGGGVQVRWATATELNSAYFEVERSTDGHSFSKVSKVASYGTTGRPQAYASLDEQAPATQLYYRLHQVDTDNTAVYSAVVSLGATEAATLTAHPNPAQTQLTLPAAAGQQVQVLDLTGRVLHTATLPASGELSVEKLPAGTYLLRLPLAGQGRTLRFTKE